ncbi:carbohydrate ABC transporter permease [Paenibacillus sp. PAMC21692]|uniref:carbohydrate ABC transporter permease n=1 Tax=Paenibacillus sp. PAMC21692 TaxID=2762320 RepID=UPI00164D1ED8|nr:carbohydrate ABC transporter permease [Paenibacillus sp. PAMC21692]QNK57261.1 carbohydrate ABC transporter permease [Paenibacillus sp. PAMC21692]
MESLPSQWQQAKQQIQRVWFGRGAQKAKRLVIGQNLNDGIAAKAIIMMMLSFIAYLYLQPLLYMVTTMIKPLADLLDPTIKWIPRSLDWSNLQKAWYGLQYPEAFRNTLFIALCCSIFQVAVCAITGYALARLQFFGRNFAFFLIILTFLVPPQIIIIPLYTIYGQLGWLNTPLVFLIPALFGQGLRSALFIIIFRQFFSTLPKALEEAAKMDGASGLYLFARIMLPLARPAALVVFLFSFIWYWNMYYEPSMFLSTNFTPLSIRLSSLETVLLGPNLTGLVTAQNPITEGTKMAGAFMIIAPPLLVYMVTQRWFVESIDRTGLIE